MVLCFSATGNSRLAAQVLAGKLGDELVSLNEVFKARKEWVFRSEAPYVLVAPIYAWRLPKQVEAFLKRARLLGNRQIYVLATMGQSSGAAREYCKAAVEGNGMAFMGFQGIVMPDNYMVSYPMPSREEAASIIKSALPVLAQAAAARVHRFDCSGPEAIRVSLPFAAASPTINSRLRSLFPPGPRPVRSSRLIYSPS